MGSCVLKASVDRVSVDTIGQYVDRHSADISADTRSMCRPRLGRVSVDINRQGCRSTPGRYFTATRPPVGHHSADTLPTLSQHYALLISSCYRVLSSVLYWERLSVTVVLFWPITPTIFMSFFQLCFFLVIAFIYDPRYFSSDAAAFGNCCFWRLVILGEQKMI